MGVYIDIHIDRYTTTQKTHKQKKVTTYLEYEMCPPKCSDAYIIAKLLKRGSSSFDCLKREEHDTRIENEDATLVQKGSNSSDHAWLNWL